MKKTIFINSHPIQYFAPMYKFLSEQGTDNSVWYASNNFTDNNIDKEFGVKIKWDLPLLEGYNYRFYKNYSWKPSHSTGFWGLMNFGMIYEIFKIPQSVIIIHGWHYFTHFVIIMLAKLKGHTVCLRNETPLIHEDLKSGWKHRIKKAGLKYILFPRVSYFLYIGKQNKLFYESYNISSERLIYCPYAVDNDRFNQLVYNVADIRGRLQIPKNDKVILFSAKYIDKKRPLDLLKAFKLLNQKDCWLLMVGEGELRKEMEDYIRQHNIPNVLLTGFVNQSLIAQYYAISDVFVMCSSLGETWGLSANEAMNFNLPLVLSSLTGSSEDLVVNGTNGYIFKTGDVEDLAKKLRSILYDKSLTWQITSKEIIKDFSYSTILSNLKAILQ